MAGQSALWQVQTSAANGTESTATSTNTVLFNEAPVVASGGVIFSSEYNIRNSVAENPKVDGNNNDVQDMGLDGIDVQITGIIKDSDSSNATIAKLMAWVKETKTTTGFTEGRLGLRVDDFPHFNMTPTSTYGFVLQSLKFVRDGETKNKAGFVLVVRVGGDVSGWLTANGF
jgi:hypothetical protein